MAETHISIAQLIATLPTIISQPALRAEGGVRYEAVEMVGYISPRLLVAVPPVPGAALVLIAAPAAVGKSTLATVIAQKTGAPLWDLSQIQVASGTFLGTMAKVHGADVLADLIGELVDGRFLIVMDALDEAEVHATGAGFDAFLDGIRDLVESPRPRPVVVMCARNETADYIALYCSDVAMVRYDIEFFTRNTAIEFVDACLDRSARAQDLPPRHRTQRKAFERARDRLFQFLAVSLLADQIPSWSQGDLLEWAADDEWAWSHPRVQGFLGYAPVLQAISEYLMASSDNFLRVRSELEGEIGRLSKAAPSSEQWRFVHSIILRLLEREQSKIVTQVKAKCHESQEWIGWSSLYTPAEQCERVLGRLHGTTLFPRFQQLTSVPAEVMEQYSTSLSSALPNHPFLGSRSGFANVVFREYVYAYSMVHGNNEAKTNTRNALKHGAYLPTPLLMRFVSVFLEKSEGECLEGADLGFVYESLASLERHGEGIRTIVAIGEDGVTGTAAFGSRVGTRGDEIYLDLDTSNGIAFWRRLRHAKIVGNCAVIFGFPGQTFSLGPAVDVSCSRIRFAVDRLGVDVRDAGVVRVEAREGYESTGHEPDVRIYGEGMFAVSWEPMVHPWQKYQRGQAAHEGFAWELGEPFVQLCRIVSALGALQGAPVTWSSLWRDGAVKDLGSRRLFRLLTDWKIVKEIAADAKGAHVTYVLDEAVMVSGGLTRSDLHDRIIAAPAIDLLTKVLATRWR